jgi:hypothetical protein
MYDRMVAVDVHREFANWWVIKEEGPECLVVRHFDHAAAPTIAVYRFGLSSTGAVKSKPSSAAFEPRIQAGEFVSGGKWTRCVGNQKLTRWKPSR